MNLVLRVISRKLRTKSSNFETNGKIWKRAIAHWIHWINERKTNFLFWKILLRFEIRECQIKSSKRVVKIDISL